MSAGQPSFVGVLEAPLPGHPVVGDTLVVRGWALVDGQPVQDAWARWGDGDEARLQTGIARGDVAEAFSDTPPMAPCGFAATLRLPATEEGGQVFNVTLRDHAGRLHRWSRKLERLSVDAAYRRWLASTAEQPARATDGPRVHWLVRGRHGCPPTIHDLVPWGPRAAARWSASAWPAGAPASEPLPTDVDWVGVVLAGDTPHPDLAVRIAAAHRRPADAIYIDHDHLDPDALPANPVFKPGWSPELLGCGELTSRGWLVRRAHADDGAADPETAAARWLAAATAEVPPSHLAGPGLRAGPQAAAPAPASTAPQPAKASAGAATTAVLILSRLGDAALFERCLAGLRGQPGGDALEILVGLNNVEDVPRERARALLRAYGAQVLELPGRFNWSAMNNALARATGRPHLLFFNDDVVPLPGDWLGAMHTLLARDGIGVVGAVLHYPDRTIQHAGVTVRADPELVCRHRFRDATGEEARVARWLALDRRQSAVTGACLLSHATTFAALGGFDEGLPIVLNDVDFCLRARDRGWASAVAAGARLVHHEGQSRGGLPERADREAFLAKWAGRLPMRDPFDNPMLDPDRDDWLFRITASPLEDTAST